jgi:CheY-like chemotaxis protein
MVRTLARTILVTSGYVVLEAHDGGEALAMSESHEGVIDLLLTDVMMPVLGGRDLAERAAIKRPGMKVLFMSGHTPDVVLREASEAGSHSCQSHSVQPIWCTKFERFSIHPPDLRRRAGDDEERRSADPRGLERTVLRDASGRRSSPPALRDRGPRLAPNRLFRDADVVTTPMATSQPLPRRKSAGCGPAAAPSAALAVLFIREVLRTMVFC